MKFESAHLVEETLWTMRLADLPRGESRAKIASLGNGNPPYTKDEMDQDPTIDVNVNFLSFAKYLADARRSYYNAFLKPGVFFNVTVDSPQTRALEWSRRITKEINSIMKGSLPYLEFLRSQFALTVMHGIGPGFWDNPNRWYPRCMGIEDVMIPSGTLLSMDNLAYFGVFRQWTAMEFYQMTHGHAVDSRWNMPVVKAALKWVNESIYNQVSYNEAFSPEKVEERFHQDLGYYGTDAVPTIDAWDFYWWSDEGKHAGWRRGIVLDTPTSDEIGARATTYPTKNKIGEDHGQWLYRPANSTPYADKLSNIIHFQFADCSASAPFKYHSVRSLGWLLYAVCHLDNRLRCRFNESLFESMMQYFRVANADDRERVMKIDLHNRGVIPQDVQMVSRNDRWQVDGNLLSMGLQQNQQMMAEAAAQYREKREAQSQKTEKTEMQVLSELIAANALVSSTLDLGYEYGRFRDREICRRFCQKDSKDPDVMEFRKRCLHHGVPEEMLDVSRWNVEPERVMGSGNKILQIAMANSLMQIRAQLDPESQREVDHLYILANSDDPDVANRLVPMEGKRISDSVNKAEMMVGSLMAGVQIDQGKGENPEEMANTLMKSMTTIMAPLMKGESKPTMEVLRGLDNIGQHVNKYLSKLAEDEKERAKVKELQKHLDVLEKALKSLVKALPQPQQGGNGAMDPKDQAKIQGTIIMAKTKAQLAAESHRQRTTQRDVQFQEKIQQDSERHNLEMIKEAQRSRADRAAKDLQTASEIKRSRMKTLEGPKGE